MRMQICSQFKDATEEINWNQCARLQKNKIKNKKCNVGLELDSQYDKKRTNSKFFFFYDFRAKNKRSRTSSVWMGGVNSD